MPKFMCQHTLQPGAMTQRVMDMFADSAQEHAAIRGYRSFLNLTEGKIVCVVEAPSKEVLAAWFEQMRMPCDSIVHVEFEGCLCNVVSTPDVLFGGLEIELRKMKWMAEN